MLRRLIVHGLRYTFDHGIASQSQADTHCRSTLHEMSVDELLSLHNHISAIAGSPFSCEEALPSWVKKANPFGGGARTYRCRISKCFRPNRRASTDHAPGPIIANDAPDVAKRIGIPPQPQENATHTSMTVTSAPQKGVNKPRSRKIAAPAPIKCGSIKANGGASLRCANPKQNRNVAVTRRSRKRPLPGQLFGNVEKRRCKHTPFPS